ncbi:hypothetical protein RUM43_001803 [Polyplax serrata]|uniref:Uncharacterized protein n=1 Tax=Polyplax serrata TaxID=468196 RepID=A0AAN8SJG8_POLSC
MPNSRHMEKSTEIPDSKYFQERRLTENRMGRAENECRLGRTQRRVHFELLLVRWGKSLQEPKMDSILSESENQDTMIPCTCVASHTS